MDNTDYAASSFWKPTHNAYAYDLSDECISCAVDLGGKPCGVKVAMCGGTTNFWGHLFVHHRAVWLQLKNEDGALTEVGEAEMALLQNSMNRDSKACMTLLYPQYIKCVEAGE